ncbi:hypothetical protein HGG75_27555 [Ochrobactrum pseudogrignonense]|nr:hypothetical protein [Brucella pseudogrignonensis]
MKAERETSIELTPSISLDGTSILSDIREYGRNGIGTWRELRDASLIVSGFLGISQSAYQEAIRFMGPETASTAIAWILQKLSTINSHGGYLRSLTQKAREGLLHQPASVFGNEGKWMSRLKMRLR